MSTPRKNHAKPKQKRAASPKRQADAAAAKRHIAKLMAEEQPPNPVGRPSKYEPRFCAMVKEEMAKGFSLTAFAGIIGVDRGTLDNWARENEEFFIAVKYAKALRLLQWEKIGLKLAVQGGAAASATMTVFGLKNMGGDEWADKQQHQHSAPDGGAVKHEIVMTVVDPKAK
jgi:hypothetical protein